MHEDSVDKFLSAMTTQPKFPFSTEELRQELKHTFWLLNRVDGAKALAKKLEAHPVFGEYKLILAAGDGRLDDEEATEKSYDKVADAISKYEKTITLSVGQLTTGITIPEWTAVLMLSNIKSPALYMQAAFRSQNPCLFSDNGEFYRKENAYVFDFDPARTLIIYERFANDLSAETSEGKGDADKLNEMIADMDTIREPINYPVEKLKQALHTEAVKPIIDIAKEKYASDMKSSDSKQIERGLKAETDSFVDKAFGDYRIESNIIEKERQEELGRRIATRKSEEEVNQEFDRRKEEAALRLQETLNSSISNFQKAAAEEVVGTIETSKKERDKKGIEDSIKDHLRGFSRTIPSFLMAYGTEETTLENFDAIIPDDVFMEVTSISLAQFRLLRDGRTYTNEQTGEEEIFEGKFFDSVVFNDSVREFLNLKKKLANYFDENSTEDIFDYIPPQKTNQIFTPKWVVKKMVDMLAEENPGCFDMPDKTFIDPYMKSGMYITEIVKRLYQNEAMKKLYPKDEERLCHIFEKQVYGLAPTEIIYRIALEFILGFAEEGFIKAHNFRQADALQYAKDGNLEQKLSEIYG